MVQQRGIAKVESGNPKYNKQFVKTPYKYTTNLTTYYMERYRCFVLWFYILQYMLLLNKKTQELRKMPLFRLPLHLLQGYEAIIHLCMIPLLFLNWNNLNLWLHFVVYSFMN